MASKVITLSLPVELLKQIDRLAKLENRARSEVLREGFRRYMSDAERWQQIRKIGARSAAAAGVSSEEDVYRMINDYRRKKSQKRRRRNARRS